LWTKFSKTLEKVNRKIEFWLFKMPPSFKYNSENLYTVSSFFSNTQLKNNAVIEFRDPSWWKVIDEIENIGIVFCSVDAPDLPRTRIVTNNTIYLRIHGYKQWYQYIYSKAELDSILTSVRGLKADKKAIYFNNNHGMLENGLYSIRKFGIRRGA
jgi:uncharacterized protein YecE (DUF72 family)